MAENLRVFRGLFYMSERRKMLPGKHQDVYGGLGMDVAKSDDLFILKEFLRGNCTAHDAAKQAIHADTALLKSSISVRRLQTR